MHEVLSLFHEAVAAWFASEIGEPSPPQIQGWPSIAAGKHTLILSPTGSGKTLAAFLWCLDHCMRVPEAQNPAVRILYISPLKALNNDIERNLQAPLRGIREYAKRMGFSLPELRTAVRTGDTPSKIRQQMVKKPPHILITTPESLYLILTSPTAREILRGVEYCIVDEIHALCGNKRGVHLSLSLERLVHLCGREFVRIGLSATQRPLELVARFLGGQDDRGQPRHVNIVDARFDKQLHLDIRHPAADWQVKRSGSVWDLVAPEVLEIVNEHRSTLVFANARRTAERLAFKMNSLAGEDAAYAHHGSISKERRKTVEQALKNGELRCVVATSSLELGIDIGNIDHVVQIQSPKSISQALQRIGRSGHSVTSASKGTFIATHPHDLLETAVVAKAALEGDIEPVSIPECCLDVLAQQIVAMASVEEWSEESLYNCVRRAYPYRNLTMHQLKAVLEMLSGRYSSRAPKELSPRIVWDAVNGVIRGASGSRMLAVRSGGTIPDRGYYGLYLTDGTTRIGELDEEFVFERRVGDCFQLGTSTWRIEAITHDKVLVSPHFGAPGMMPFWRGEYFARSYHLSLRVGKLCRELEAAVEEEKCLGYLKANYPLDQASASSLADYIRRQKRSTQRVPSDKCVVLEQSRDESGQPMFILHSLFGGRVNSAWALLISRQMRTAAGAKLQWVFSDDAIMFHGPVGVDIALVEAAVRIDPDLVEQLLVEELLESSLFGARFRENAARALVLTKPNPRKRSVLWIQRLRAKDLLEAVRECPEFPITLESLRECLKDHIEVDALKDILRGLQEGAIELVCVCTEVPSPFAGNLLWQYTNEYLYEDDTPHRSAVHPSVNRELLSQMIGLNRMKGLLDPCAVTKLESRLQRTSQERRANNPDELHHILLSLGDLCAEPPGESELDLRCAESAELMVQRLAADGRAVEFVHPNSGTKHWIAAEDWPLYRDAFGLSERNLRLPDHLAHVKYKPFDALLQLVQRYLETHGPVSQASLVARFGCGSEDEVLAVLNVLASRGEICRGEFLDGVESPQWCSIDVLEQLRRMSLHFARREFEPCTPEEYARFLLRWQHVEPGSRLEGPEGLETALQLLDGLCLPAEVWERDVLPSRVNGYQPAWLDALAARGEVRWFGVPACSPGWIALTCSDISPRRAESDSATDRNLSKLAAEVLDVLDRRGALFFSDLLYETGTTTNELNDALWELVWKGLITNDTFDALRTGIRWEFKSPPSSAPSVAKGSLSMMHRRRAAVRSAVRARIQAVPWSGRWASLSPQGDFTEEELMAAALRALYRYGVITRDLCASEPLLPPWSLLYPILERMEFAGEVRRGYFINGVSGAQFALPEAVAMMSDVKREALTSQRLSTEHQGFSTAKPTRGASLVLVNSMDPCFSHGALRFSNTQPELKRQRSPSTYVVLNAGRPVLVAENWAERVWFAPDISSEVFRQTLECLKQLAQILMRGPSAGRTKRYVEILEVNGQPVIDSQAADILAELGFEKSYKSVMMWG